MLGTFSVRKGKRKALVDYVPVAVMPIKFADKSFFFFFAEAHECRRRNAEVCLVLRVRVIDMFAFPFCFVFWGGELRWKSWRLNSQS